MRTAALERAIRRSGPYRAAPRAETCSLCAAALPEDHPHLLDTEAGRPRCVCRACSLLFDRPEASQGLYRSIPDRRRRLDGVDAARLHVPVGLAFFVVEDGGEVAAHYPSPAGATRWEVDPGDWAAAVAACPDLAGLAPGVEALLVDAIGGSAEAWIVPVSDCYRLVGAIRSVWEGLAGGDGVRDAIAACFDDLRRSDGQGTHR